MTTYAFLGDAAATSKPPHMFAAKAHPVVLHRQFKVADIIASNATLTTNGYITADDIVTLLPMIDGLSLDKVILRVITAGTASVTADVGLAGGAEMIADAALDAAAGTRYRTTESETYDMGVEVAATDTLDIQFKVANIATGEFEIFAIGHMLKLGSAT
jgi:hypothetical protein